MKFIKLLSLLLLTAQITLAQEVNVMSYNIRYDNPNDNENWWGNRKESVLDIIKSNELMAFGVQEAVNAQMEYLDENLPNYSFIGVGRDDAQKGGEFSAIFYRSDLKVIESGTFWLSPTPDLVSKGWDAALPRICTYGLFELENGDRFWIFNTHFDHRGVEARAESAKLIVDKIKELSANDSLPIILTGDFNTTPDKAPYANITSYMNDAAKESNTRPEGPVGTFSGFDTEAKLLERIDYIFSKNADVLNYAHLDMKRDNGLWPSDHLPVLSKIRIN